MFLSVLSHLIGWIGVVGLMLSARIYIYGLVSLTDFFYGRSIVLAVDSIFVALVGFAMFLLLKKLYKYINKIKKQFKPVKILPFTEKYGANYPEPKYEDFGITRAEFEEYNKRFQFEYIKLIFTYGLFLAVCIYLMASDFKKSSIILILGFTIALFFLLNYIFNYWNEKISQRHRSYKKIKQFQESCRIYCKIRSEARDYN